MRDDASAYDTEDEQGGTNPYGRTDMPEEKPPESWEEENTDDLSKENEADLEGDQNLSDDQGRP